MTPGSKNQTIIIIPKGGEHVKTKNQEQKEKNSENTTPDHGRNGVRGHCGGYDRFMVSV